MLINLSNHPLSGWDTKQLEAATRYGKLIELPFPEVDPTKDEKYIQSICQNFQAKVEILFSKSCDQFNAVHIMGEHNLTYALVEKLKKKGICCIASTTSRSSKEIEKGIKESIFIFVRFRNY